MYLPAVSLARIILTTCPLRKPKYFATGSEVNIFGRWFSSKRL